jgi:hypothetical protein
MSQTPEYQNGKEVTTQGKQQEKVKEHACMEEDFVLTIMGSQPIKMVDKLKYLGRLIT